jgi:hypothetical protein
MFFAKRCFIGSLLIFGGVLNACAEQQPRSGSANEVVAYRLQIFNESSENIRYRYTRLVPHEEPILPQDPSPQATIDIGLVFETIAPGESTVVTLKPGKKLTLFSPGPNGTQETEITAEASLRLYVTPEGIYREENGDRVLIRIDE